MIGNRDRMRQNADVIVNNPMVLWSLLKLEKEIKTTIGYCSSSKQSKKNVFSAKFCVEYL